MKTTHQLTKPKRRDRFIQERVHDPYKSKTKPPEPTVCPVCQAVFKEGRWQWRDSWPEKSHKETCQACQRIQDDFPAGLVRLGGDFYLAHKDEIMHLILRLEEKEKSDHPLNRIMNIREEGPDLFIETTDLHLPRRLGEALQRAYKGYLHTHYSEGECFVRVNWTRDL